MESLNIRVSSIEFFPDEDHGDSPLTSFFGEGLEERKRKERERKRKKKEKKKEKEKEKKKESTKTMKMSEERGEVAQDGERSVTCCMEAPSFKSSSSITLALHPIELNKFWKEG